MPADGPFDLSRVTNRGPLTPWAPARMDAAGPAQLPRGTLLLDATAGLKALARLLAQGELHGDVSRVHVAGACPDEIVTLIAEVAGVPVSRAGSSHVHHPRPGPPLDRLARLALLHAYLRGGHLATAALNWLMRGDAPPAPALAPPARFAPGGGARIIPFPRSRPEPSPGQAPRAVPLHRLAAGGETDPRPPRGIARPALWLASSDRPDRPGAERGAPERPGTQGEAPRGPDASSARPERGQPTGVPEAPAPVDKGPRLHQRRRPERILAERVDPAFAARLLALVQRRGAIPFSEYQRWCHTAPGGFYEAGTVSIGSIGSADFLTAPEQSPHFGRVTARALHAMYEAMGGADRFSVDAGRPFRIAEIGAGNGTWARDILAKIRDAYPRFHARLRYTIVERSPALIARQQSRLEGAPVDWILGSADRLPLADIEGAVISNELLDDLPVSLVYRDRGELHEVHVAADAQHRFIEVGAPLSASAQAALRHYDPPAEGQTITLNTGAIEWMERVGRALRPGSYVLTIDYGKQDASELLPWGFFRTKIDLDWVYRFPGAMNITSAVSFRHLARAGHTVGLVPGDAPRFRPLQSQGRFLSAHGLREELRAETDPYQARLANRLDFAGFYVMVQRKADPGAGLSAPAPTPGS